MHRHRAIKTLMIITCSALWLATISVGLQMIREGAEGRGLGVVEDTLRAVAVTFTISAAVLYRARRVSQDRFEYGYLAGQRDSRPRRVVSIASHGFAENRQVEIAEAPTNYGED